MMSVDIIKLEREIRLADKCRNFEWIENQFKKGRLTTSNGMVFTENTFSEFRLAVKCAQEIYEDHWDLDITVHSVRSKISIQVNGIIIHFPEVEIRNSRGQKHTILDLFIGVYFDLHTVAGSRRLKIRGVHGGRMTVSFAEHSSRYMHSHLTSFNVMDRGTKAPFFQPFCTGSGEINIYAADLREDGFEYERLIKYFMQLSVLASWESLEGTPYQYISKIAIRGAGGIRRSISRPSEGDARNLQNLLIREHKEKGIIPNIEFALSGQQYVILDNAKLDAFLNSTTFTETQKKRYLCMLDPDGTYYSYGNEGISTLPAPIINKTFIFKGEELQYTVGPNPNIQVSTAVYEIHPTLKKIIKENLEYETNRKTIRKGTIDRYKN